MFFERFTANNSIKCFTCSANKRQNTVLTHRNSFYESKPKTREDLWNLADSYLVKIDKSPLKGLNCSPENSSPLHPIERRLSNQSNLPGFKDEPKSFIKENKIVVSQNIEMFQNLTRNIAK
jgi:hypothetical protein